MNAKSSSILTSTAVMAAGTVFSRMSGYIRNAMLVAAIGSQLHADLFNIANTIPNMLYILLAGGLFNAVLVPQLVRAIKNDPDGGAAYTNRIITLAALFLAGVTAVLIVAAPLVMQIFLNDCFYTPGMQAQLDSVITFARFCLPQVFFYGMFVLLGQVLNARGVFGPMMWAPITNNIISIGVLTAYLLTFGPAEGAELTGAFSAGQERLLGLGATAGIVVQFLVLIPYLRRTGFKFRARTDFHGSGLGHTLRLGMWTVLFVVVNQIAYTVVVRLASSGTTAGCTASTTGTGYTVYSNSFLLVMVPHAVITVSLATALLPRLSAYAADRDYRRLGRTLGENLRTTYAVLLPLLVLIPIVALLAARVVFGYGAGNDSYRSYVPSLSVFAIGLIFFTAHYLTLRGFYALEQNKRVFFIQCAVAATNIVAAIALTNNSTPAQTAPRLAMAYGLAYVVGAAISYTVLSREVGGLGSAQTLQFAVRAGAATTIAGGCAYALNVWLDPIAVGGSMVLTLGILALISLVMLAVYFVAARVLKVHEVNEVVGIFARRLRRRGRS